MHKTLAPEQEIFLRQGSCTEHPPRECAHEFGKGGTRQEVARPVPTTQPLRSWCSVSADSQAIRGIQHGTEQTAQQQKEGSLRTFWCTANRKAGGQEELRRWSLAAAVLATLALGATPAAWAQENQEKKADLTEVSIESLMNVEVTSASKKEQKLSRVAAAIFVITKEDIRRSGATNIADLLRMVPGVNVAQINANTWAVSARGFNFEFANKLLVLIAL